MKTRLYVDVPAAQQLYNLVANITFIAALVTGQDIRTLLIIFFFVHDSQAMLHEHMFKGLRDKLYEKPKRETH